MNAMMQNPQMQEMMRQFGQGGGMPGMGGAAGQQAATSNPTHNEVIKITSLVQL